MTNAEQFKATAYNRFSRLNTEQLIEMAHELANDFRDEACMVSDLLFHYLEERMPESEYIALCDNIYHA